MVAAALRYLQVVSAVATKGHWPCPCGSNNKLRDCCAEDVAALDTATRDLAETVAAKLSSAVRIGKQAFYEQIQMPLDAAYEYTGQVMATNMMDTDTAEGIQAFIEKRKPDWS